MHVNVESGFNNASGTFLFDFFFLILDKKLQLDERI